MMNLVILMIARFRRLIIILRMSIKEGATLFIFSVFLFTTKGHLCIM